MAVSSLPLPLGSTVPDFSLPDTVSGATVTLDDALSKHATVIMFLCNHCPYVVHINSALVILANEYINKGISFVGVSSNDVSRYPEDSPEKMKSTAKELQYPFPYLYDKTQQTAKDYKAVCTPEFYIINGQKELLYHGQFDDTRPGSGLQSNGRDVKAALDNILNNQPVDPMQKPGIGCSIKWRIE